MSQELNKKLAEWAGFTYSGKYDEWEWKRPDGILKIGLPNFTNSLDACFKWLVPKGDIWTITFIYSATDVECVIVLNKGETSRARAELEKEALALCLAIEKLIDSEVASASSGQ